MTASAQSNQGGNDSFVPVSGSTAFEAPGGAAAPATSAVGPLNLSFLDGTFQVGGYGNYGPQTSANLTPQGQVLPADMPLGGIFGSAPAASSGGISATWLILGAAAVLAAYFFLRKRS
jgi:hypothetical protein